MRRALLLALCAGCTNANLYSASLEPNLPNKIGVQADICTDDPSNVAFPEKLLVVMDGTTQLVSADMLASRASAVNNLIMRYQQNPNYSFGVIQYAGQATSETMGFPTDTAQVAKAVQQLQIGTTDGSRSYINALRSLSAAVEDDILHSPPGLRSRTRYKIIFVSFGPPNPDLMTSLCQAQAIPVMDPMCLQSFLTNFCPNDNPPPNDCEGLFYTRQVSGLRDFALSHGAQALEFHAIALGGDMRMQGLLNEMATAGHGTFLVEAPTAVNVLAIDLTTASTVMNRRELVVFNPNIVLDRDGKELPDSDADGLGDAQEMAIGTDPTNWDTDGDHVGDGIEFTLKAPGLPFDPLVATMFQACSMIRDLTVDTDQDGLNDCEEAVLRTDPTLVDTDKDGIPDIVEVRRGGNPFLDDTLFDTAKDGIGDGAKMREGLYVTDNASAYELDDAYRYHVADEGQKVVLGFNPTDPIPGVHITTITTNNDEIGLIHYDPGPPATLAWSDSAMGTQPGTPLDVSAGGTFTLASQSMQMLTVQVDRTLLPLPVLGAQDVTVVVSSNARNCFEFDVHNVTLVQTLEVPGGRPGPGWQNLRVYFAELPADSPQAYPIFNLATVPARFVAPDQKTPNKPIVQTTQDDFALMAGNL